jgi:hypothetical protein
LDSFENVKNMDNRYDNLQEPHTPQAGRESNAAQKTEQTSHFKKALVPLDEYAAREGIPADILEQQGGLGVVQIRKFKGKKYVVDVPFDALSAFEEDDESSAVRTRNARGGTGRSTKPTNHIAVAAVIFALAVVSLLYVWNVLRLSDLRVQYADLQQKYQLVTDSGRNVESVRSELANARAELARVQSQIVVSRAELEKIQADLAKARRNIETIQNELTGIQGQLSLSRAEIEGVQDVLNTGKKDLDNLHQQNAELSGAK